MNHGLAFLDTEFDTLESEVAEIPTCHSYGADPVGYAENVLGITTLTDVQKDILRSLIEFPYRTLVKSGHNQGKSFVAAVAANWFYDSFDPGIVISTAPDARQVDDVLWGEIRIMRMKAGLGDLMPAASEMRSGPAHYAKGFTSRNGTGFQGRHGQRMLFLFDEAVDIDPVYWESVSTMFRPQPGFAWLAIFNPTDISSQAYEEDHATLPTGEPKWKQFTLDALTHPNILKYEPGVEASIPNAVTYLHVDQWVHDWCESVRPEERSNEDIEWPFGSGKYWRQGPIFLARCRGLWPSLGAETIWSDLLWSMVLARPLAGSSPNLRGLLPEIGCDCARYGDDFTSIHVRWGDTSLHHESWNGWGADKTFARLKDLAFEWAAKATAHRDPAAIGVTPQQIVLKLDDDGIGGTLCDFLQRDGYFAVPIGAATKSISGRYPNKRSELWFQVADRARMGKLGVALLPEDVKRRLRAQCLRISYDLNAAGQRVVEPKDITKELIGRSPDDCFVAGTMILTRAGQKPIEAVRIGEFAWTRQGWRKIVNAGVTHRRSEVATVTFSNGQSLTGTLNHPIFVHGKGWTSIDALDLADIVQVCENQSSSTASNSSAIRTSKACLEAGITTQIQRNFAKNMGRCTKRFGVTTMGLFQRATTSTTKATNSATTTSPISNASRLKSIASDTPEPSTQRCSRTSIESAISRKNGTLPKRAESGTLSMRKRWGLANENRSPMFAKSAVSTTRQSTSVRDFAARSACNETIIETRSGGRNRTVQNAEPRPIVHPEEQVSAALVRVVSVVASGSQKVYNLTVEDAHEYFANGVLVHNCDAMNLAYLEGYDPGTAKFIGSAIPPRDPWSAGQDAPHQTGSKRSIFGV